mmetsp:Transcript_24562/g.36041  ORF Transcript_24562/g.36041 Transcript_24562/m.36041 type:complete len:227 (+) Transcript_24562:124-804(+)
MLNAHVAGAMTTPTPSLSKTMLKTDPQIYGMDPHIYGVPQCPPIGRGSPGFGPKCRSVKPDKPSPDSILWFMKEQAHEGIMAKGDNTLNNAVSVLAGLSRLSSKRRAPEASTPSTVPVKRVATASSDTVTSAAHMVAASDFFDDFRLESKRLFGVDLADHFADIKLPYSVGPNVAFVPTETAMKPVGSKPGSDKYKSARLWLAVQPQSLANGERKLIVKPALLNSS